MRETIFQDLTHSSGRSLAPMVGERLAAYLTDGSAYTLVHETREGSLYRVLVDVGARVAIQVWDPLEDDVKVPYGACQECGGPLPYGGHVATPLCDACLSQPLPQETPPEPAREPVARELDTDSETDTVAAWVKRQGLQGFVSGAWLWVDDSVPNRLKAGGEDGAGLAALLTANGFRISKRRGSWFHMCGVRPKGERPTGRKLSRMHNTVPVDQFRPATYDPRPAWQQAKTRKRRAA